MTASPSRIGAERRNGTAILTLERPEALNALSLDMVRDLTAWLLRWRDDPSVAGVVFRGAAREGRPLAFCAGGDIRFFHSAALAGDPQLEDFFTEEYALDHLVHNYPKPTLTLMDGIVMGGGMGIAQGTRLRVATERLKMAMPETNIGFFPDVGGGWFLARCPGRAGEYLALGGEVLGAGDAIAWGLADGYAPSQALPALLESLCASPVQDGAAWLERARAGLAAAPQPEHAMQQAHIDRIFGHEDLVAILAELAAGDDDWSRRLHAALQARSPLMMAVSLEQVRRARGMSLAEDLRMERDIVRNCFHLRPGAAGETVEGIRALAVDKDRTPRWNPPQAAAVTPDMVEAFFRSPWPAHAHPLRDLR